MGAATEESVGRKPRVHVPGGFYHAILRGNGRKPVFFCADDRDRWEGCLDRALQRYDGSLHCYCWMTNHVHLVIEVGHAPLSRIMQYAASTYARRTNRLLGTSGHLFERRHRAFLVRDDRYLLGLVRYIHNNPVRAQLAEVPEAYAWSSHRAYLGEVTRDWLRTDRVLSLFSRRRTLAVRHYRDFMHGVDPTAVRYEDAAADDCEGVSGLSVQSGAAGLEREGADSLESIVLQHCAQHRLTVAQLTGPSRARFLAQVRADIASEALRTGVATLADVSRRLNRSEATLCEALTRRRKT